MCTFCICTQTPSVSSVYKHVPTSQYVLTVDKHFMYINTYQPSSIYFVYLLYTNTYSQSVCTFCTHNYQSISMYLLYPHIPINQYVPSVQKHVPTNRYVPSVHKHVLTNQFVLYVPQNPHQSVRTLCTRKRPHPSVCTLCT